MDFARDHRVFDPTVPHKVTSAPAYCLWSFLGRQDVHGFRGVDLLIRSNVGLGWVGSCGVFYFYFSE